MGKWEKFHSTYSPIQIIKANEGKPHLQLDWYRATGQDIKINNIPLSEYAKNFNNFESEKDVKKFFNDVILSGMKSANAKEKEQMVDYLATTFHQGGFLYPVSSPLAVMMKDKEGAFYAIAKNDSPKSINIQITETGFRIQEFVTVPNLTIHNDYIETFNVPEDEPVLLPDKGKSYVIKAQGTINIDFSKDPTNPDVVVESNTISFGSKVIETKLDQRTFVEKFKDFLKDIFGMNKVKSIAKESPKEEQAELEEPNQRTSPRP